MTSKTDKTNRRLNASGDITSFMAHYYRELDAASNTGEKKIAWCTSVGPAEILRAMGFLVYFPETHAAMIGASRMAVDLIPKATRIGFSPDICSYLTADIGAYLAGASPLKKVYKDIEGPPKPDILVFNTNQCRDVQDWFMWYGREFNVPVIGIHTYVGVSDVTADYIPSITRQMERLLDPLEAVSGNKYDPERLKDVIAWSRECSDLWKKVLETGCNRPSPISFFDAATLMGPAVVGRGTPDACTCYRNLLDELEERVANGIGAVSPERFRIYWDGMPVWGRLRAHSDLFSALDACVLASTYCSSWIFTALDPDDPFESMARAYTELFIVRSEAYKETYLKAMLDLYDIDGIVYHDAKTCPNNSNSRYGLPGRLETVTGIPALIIDGDLNDLRLLSDEQTKTNVEAFIEQLEENTD